jgi:pyruvate, orthophosphate dikinase
MAAKRVYFFGGGKADGNIGMKDVLGEKGAALADMTRLGLAVPPGFTVGTEACALYFRNREKLSPDVTREIAVNLAKLERAAGRRFGDPKRPLLLSVRWGGGHAAPGRTNAILNLGLNDKTVEGLAAHSGDARFAYDCYARFLAAFSRDVLDIPAAELDACRGGVSQGPGGSRGADDLKEECRRIKALVRSQRRKEFPPDAQVQLALARDAAYRSWRRNRARSCRKADGTPDEVGAAVTVQAMVFGNRGTASAAGVGVTRNPSTGAKEFAGEFLVNAQGEEVGAGIRTPRPVREMRKHLPKVFEQLVRVAAKLERRYADVQEFEFVVEEGKLYLLQTRPGKRTAAAAVRVAVDLVKERLITKEEALLRLDAGQIEQLLHPVIDPAAPREVIARGLAASPGAATGAVVFDAGKAVERAAEGKDVILVRKETGPDDIRGMHAARGILTTRGGMTSHAAVVARQIGKSCVVGCDAIEVDEVTNRFLVGGRFVQEGECISLNGATGEVIQGTVPLIAPRMTGAFGTLSSWADAARTLSVRAIADTPEEARVAREFGCEGIGLYRTEHMFFAQDRIPIMQEMILARTPEQREAALSRLLPMQREDFRRLYREMKGFPVTIRLLDPPLSEFLPRRDELMVEVAKLELIHADRAVLDEKRRLLARVEELHEVNPMLGLRGCRLGICYPEITRMQARAMFEAACEAVRDGIRVRLEVMVPLVSLAREMTVQRGVVVREAEEAMKRYKRRFPYAVGTMIELPRAALTAGVLARDAEFFSFGTDDLTQTTFGFSRDDSGRFIRRYMNRSSLCPRCGSSLAGDLSCAACQATWAERPGNILDSDVFATLDEEGVGQLIRMAVEKGRAARPGLKIGMCGEHGGDAATIDFCNRAGFDYVSCSPYRVPVARLAAAQAELRRKSGAKTARK